MRTRQGFSLLELIFAMAIFCVILAVSFLPFKMLRDSYRKGGGRIETQETLRAPIQRMIREIRKGTAPASGSMFGDYSTTNGYTGYRRVDFTSASGTAVSYYWRACVTSGGALANPTAGALSWPTATLVSGDPYNGFNLQPSGQPREYALIREEKQLDGRTATRAVIPRGIQVFLFTYANPPAVDIPSVVVQIGTLPADATRPLPDPGYFRSDSRRLELGTTFTLRNLSGDPPKIP